jgi:hypothetical protein
LICHFSRASRKPLHLTFLELNLGRLQTNSIFVYKP